jgi:outer membrane lipoprotein carrier protein
MVTATLGAATEARQPEGREPAVDVARRLQAHYDAVRDFSADSTQTPPGGARGPRAEERGTVLVKKPGMMRWEYEVPEKKLFVADGVKMYSWVPGDNQVIVSSVPAADRATTPVLFLVGKGNLTRDFVISYADPARVAPTSVALSLVPRNREPDYDSLTLVVDRATLRLQQLIAVDGQGGTSTFRFDNLKENVGVPDKAFSFRIPRGADVVTRD